VSVAFQRTLRIPNDGRAYPLPPGLGPFPLRRADRTPRAPAEWRARHDVIVPMYQREALWLAFDGKSWHPGVVQVGLGGIDAVAGGEWREQLRTEPQNYVVCPDQPWLDGIKVGPDVVRQFVAVPLGSGQTVEGQLTGREESGGIQLRVFAAKAGRFPERAPRSVLKSPIAARAGTLGLGAGGQIRQKIYPDRYGTETWDQSRFATVHVHLVNSLEYAELTGETPPPTPIDGRTYTEFGLPWFELYDEDRGDITASEPLTRVRPIGEPGSPADEPIEIPVEQIEGLRPP
jgi:hypothetical protein